MIQPRSASEILDREFLILRGKILEVAASLDRLERASSPQIGAGASANGHGRALTTFSDPRLPQVREALETLLLNNRTDRAEAIQQIFSRSYDPHWFDDFSKHVAPRF